MIRGPLPLALSLALAAPLAAASPPQDVTPAGRYVRFRAAEAAGDLGSASAQMEGLLAGEGGGAIAERAYRQAIVAGDHDLAVKAARLLDARHALPADGPLLFAVDAIRARDWAEARAQANRLEAGRLFAFTAPLLRAWIAQGAGDADPLATLEPARTAGLASAYHPSERVLLLLAMGRLDEATAEVRGQQQAGTRLKLLVADALLRAHRPQDAIGVLAGEDQLADETRARIAAGRPIAIEAAGPAGGVSELLTQVALDFNRQRLVPVAIVLARLATFAEPRNSSAWITTASLLGAMKMRKAALTALDPVRADDPFAGDAENLRVSLLIDIDDKEGALERARLAAARPGAGIADWDRLGDVYLALDRPREAAAAYGTAVAAASAGPAEQLWPLLDQQGTALEQAGDWPAARAALTRAAALAPGQPTVLNHLGYSLLARREDVPRATRLIAEASRLRPDDPAITDSLGWARFVGGDIGAALPLVEHAAADEPAEPAIAEHLGDIYWTVGRRIEARYAWRAAESTAEAKDLARLRAKIGDGLTPATASP